jgi:hypothetical protein
MKQSPPEQFESHLLQSEAVLWCGQPGSYRPQVHLPPMFMLAFIGFGGAIAFSIPGGHIVGIVVTVLLTSLLFSLPFISKGITSDVTLVLTNKRLLVFKSKGQLLRTNELNDVQIQRLGKDLFVVSERINSDETIKWPCACSEHPEILAIELEKLGVTKGQAV